MASAFQPTDIWGVVGGVLLLIFVYLVFAHPGTTTSLFSNGISGSISAIKTLQGR